MTIPTEALEAIREEARKAANEAWLDKTLHHEPYTSPVDWKRGYALCYERLKVAELERERWIPVEELEPNRFDIVLTYGELHITICQYSDGIWRHWESGRENKHNVTHWKPLPSPPNTK